MTDSKMPEFPERIRVRKTKVIGDHGEGEILTTAAGFGYEKCEYIRADLAHPAPVAHAELEALAEQCVSRAIKRLQGLPDYAGRPSWDSIIADEMRSALRARTAQTVGVRVKPLEWEADPYNEGDYQFWRAKAGEYIYEVGCDRTYWWQEDGAANICAIDGFPSGDAAKAAAQADYEQRIRSQVVAAPITVQDAAKVLLACNGADLDEWTDGLWPDDDATEALQALSALLPEGGA